MATATTMSLQFPSNFLPFSSSQYHYQPTSLSFYPSFFLFKNGVCSNSIICFASTKKSRPSRKLMSDEELRNVLREFVASVGLADDHIPTTKDLSLHGRKDLANIVRRRGHKSIKMLLSHTSETVLKEESETVASESDPQKGLDDNLNEIYVHEERGQEEKVNDLAKESGGTLLTDGNSSENSEVINSEQGVNFNNQSHVLTESQTSLLEKVEKFIKCGQLDTVEDDISGDLNNITVLKEGQSSSSEDVQNEPVMNDEADIGHSSFSNNTGQNGSLMILSLPMPTTMGDKITRDENLSAQRHADTSFDGNVNLEVSNMENQVEIDRLKELLRQKKLELSRLKEEIEQEKHALEILQAKAESEISKAQSLILEKDAELVAAEESLSGLVEAKIQYSGEGQMVEVAGSFNGWHQRIQLEAEPSSAVMDPVGTSKFQLWSTILWLYPGVYEIKFIVDGQWKTDPQQELTSKGEIENNLLRVER